MLQLRQPGPPLKRRLGLFDLVLFNIAAVTSMRWLAAAAHAGPIAIVLWLAAALLFFIPSALCVAELSRRFPDEGGLYIWARESFGEWHGFLCGYTYVLSNVIYFVSLSLAIVSLAATLIPRAWSDRSLLAGSLVLIWSTTLVCIAGGRLSRWIGFLAGASTCVTAAALVLTGVAAFAFGQAELPPSTGDWDWGTLNFWSQLAFAYVGLELGAVMAGEIRNPSRTIPRAAFLSGIGVSSFYIFGTLAILSLIRPAEVSPITGLAQTFQAAEERFAIPGFGTLFTITTILAMAGQLGAWIAGGSRLPFVIGLDRYMPPVLGALHPRFGTPWASLIWQAIAASVLGLAFAAGETARSAYQLLVDITVLLTFIPFLYIFAASWKTGLRASVIAGLLVTLLAMGLSVVPPAETASVWLFELKIVGGSLFLLGCGWLRFRHVKRARPVTAS